MEKEIEKGWGLLSNYMALCRPVYLPKTTAGRNEPEAGNRDPLLVQSKDATLTSTSKPLTLALGCIKTHSQNTAWKNYTVLNLGWRFYQFPQN